MEKTVKTKYLRISVKKLRFLIDSLKGKNAVSAMSKLELQSQKAAVLTSKALKSGVNLFDKKEQEQLVIKQISADEGPVFKRWRAGSRGMAKKYSKKTAHLKITLEIKNKTKNANGK
jgi:large subunit ribosomal protein L22